MKNINNMTTCYNCANRYYDENDIQCNIIGKFPCENCECPDWVLLETNHICSENCWCEPELVYLDDETGNKLFVHREIH